MTNAIQVSSIKPASIDKGFELVIVTQRDSKDKKVEEANRFRCISIPELSVPEVPSKFTSTVLEALRSIATAQLKSILDDKGFGITEVSGAIWNIDSLLAFAAKEADSKRLSKETLAAFWQASELRVRVEEKKNEALTKQWKERVLSLAAPAITLNEDQCNLTMVSIGKSEKDMANPIAVQIIERLQSRVKKLQEEAEQISEAA